MRSPFRPFLSLKWIIFILVVIFSISSCADEETNSTNSSAAETDNGTMDSHFVTVNSKCITVRIEADDQVFIESEKVKEIVNLDSVGAVVCEIISETPEDYTNNPYPVMIEASEEVGVKTRSIIEAQLKEVEVNYLVYDPDSETE